MSVVTQQSVESHAHGSFPFTAFLEIALSTHRTCALQMQSRWYLSPLLTKNCYFMWRGFCSCIQQVGNILHLVVTTCVAGVITVHTCYASTPATQVVNKLQDKCSILTTCKADPVTYNKSFSSIEGLNIRLCICNTHKHQVDKAISKKALNWKDLRAWHYIVMLSYHWHCTTFPHTCVLC